MQRTHGNRITDNAFHADDGRVLIERALSEIKERLGWFPSDQPKLFSGVYYDSQKVGSFILQVTNASGEKAVLKLQLRPVAYDEGFIIRYIEKENRSKNIRLPRILSDRPWSEERGYGFIVFEDVSDIPNLWLSGRPTEGDMARHTNFLRAFVRDVLPIKSWFSAPTISLKERYRDSFEHFFAIARASNHHHIDISEVERFRDLYFACLDKVALKDVHFTHSHLSGKDIKYDAKTDSSILLANLYWSFCPAYYEVTFPTWVDLMHILEKQISFQDVLDCVERWSVLGSEVYGHDLRKDQQYWFNLLERAMMTIMLDLGASEWKQSETQEKQALLNAWKELFHWILNVIVG